MGVIKFSDINIGERFRFFGKQAIQIKTGDFYYRYDGFLEENKSQNKEIWTPFTIDYYKNDNRNIQRIGGNWDVEKL